VQGQRPPSHSALVPKSSVCQASCHSALLTLDHQGHCHSSNSQWLIFVALCYFSALWFRIQNFTLQSDCCMTAFLQLAVWFCTPGHEALLCQSYRPRTKPEVLPCLWWNWLKTEPGLSARVPAYWVTWFPLRIQQSIGCLNTL